MLKLYKCLTDICCVCGVHVYVCLSVCACVHVHAYMYVYMYVCMYVCMFVDIIIQVYYFPSVCQLPIFSSQYCFSQKLFIAMVTASLHHGKMFCLTKACVVDEVLMFVGQG